MLRFCFDDICLSMSGTQIGQIDIWNLLKSFTLLTHIDIEHQFLFHCLWLKRVLKNSFCMTIVSHCVYTFTFNLEYHFWFIWHKRLYNITYITKTNVKLWHFIKILWTLRNKFISHRFKRRKINVTNAYSIFDKHFDLKLKVIPITSTA